jgi:hypothetical protein
MVDSSATIGFLFNASFTSAEICNNSEEILIQTSVFSTSDVTFETDKSGLLVYSQASAIDEQPCANRTESIKGIPSTQQAARPAIMASPALTLTT